MRGDGKGGTEWLVVIVIIISSFPPALLGFQEALVRQVRDLEELLGTGEFAWVRYLRTCPRSFPTFPSTLPSPPLPFLLSSIPRCLFIGLQVGVGRSDGVSAGEFCPIFYRR